MTTEPLSKVWVIRAGKGGRYASDFEQRGIVAIGFDEAGDPRGLEREALFAQTREVAGSRAGNIAGQVDRFARAMAPGDLVIVPDGSTRELLCGRITSDASYEVPPPISHFKNVRRVEWITRRDRDLLPDRVLFKLGSLLTVFAPAEQDLLRTFVESGKVGTPDEAGSDPVEPTTEGGPDDEDSTAAADQEARNRELIAKRIAGIGPYEMQDLAAGILHALGYSSEVAPPGADGGLDILACKDALFLQPPFVKAQVKARPGTKTSPDEIRQLNGLLHANDRGIFISTGGFTPAAVSEAGQMQIQLWDLPRVTALFLDNYSSLPENVADLVPLRQIWVLDDATDAEASD